MSGANRGSSFLEERQHLNTWKRTGGSSKGHTALPRPGRDSLETENLLTPASFRARARRISADVDDHTEECPTQTAFEKKIELVSEEIDYIGFGRYQWGLFIVCGSGWLLDLLWAHAFGLAMPAIQRELGFSERQYGFLSTGFSIGMTTGALSWGILLDILGRRAAFNYTVAISSLFGLCIGFSNSYALLIALATGVGFGVGGNIPVDTTIFLEFIPRTDRKMLVVMSIFQPIGSILSTLVGWALIPRFSCAKDLPSCRQVVDTPEGLCCSSAGNMGWRYMFYTISAITLFVFGLRFLAFTMFESPAFLLSHGKDSEAIQVLAEIARKNGLESRLTLADMSNQVDDEDESDQGTETDDESRDAARGLSALAIQRLSKFDLSHLKLLFKNSFTSRLTILTWLIYAADFWGFTLAGVFLPKILLEKGATQHHTVADTYREYIFIALAGIPGALVSLSLIKYGIGRRPTMFVSSVMMAASLFLFATVSSSTGNLVFNCVEYFSQTVFNAILYAWTPEVFEPSVRGSATGIAAFWGRLISIVAPLLGSIIFASQGGNQVLFAAGGGTLVASLCIVLLP